MEERETGGCEEGRGVGKGERKIGGGGDVIVGGRRENIQSTNTPKFLVKLRTELYSVRTLSPQLTKLVHTSQVANQSLPIPQHHKQPLYGHQHQFMAG